jgi:hypothetical protein
VISSRPLFLSAECHCGLAKFVSSAALVLPSLVRDASFADYFTAYES